MDYVKKFYVQLSDTMPGHDLYLLELTLTNKSLKEHSDSVNALENTDFSNSTFFSMNLSDNKNLLNSLIILLFPIVNCFPIL